MDWAAETAIALGKAAIQFIKDAIAAAGVLLIESIRIGLYLIKKALFDLYKHFRYFLVRAAYAIPFTDELTEELGGGIPATTLWKIPGEPILYTYPKEELPSLERAREHSRYMPWVPPERLAEMRGNLLLEQPLSWVSPYRGNSTPDVFIDTPVGSRLLLSSNGPINFSVVIMPGKLFTPPSDFGGAIENCEIAFQNVRAVLKAGNIPVDFFPDYNLDGDRGYGWPCWDVRRPPGGPLTPPDGKTVTVDPVLITY